MLADCDLIIFDCDGVLVDSEMLAVEAFVQVLNDAGVGATPAMIARCFGMKQADILVKITEMTGQDIPDSVVRDLWPVTRAYFERALKPMPGIAEFLAATARTKRCVASSSNPERIRSSLALTGLAPAFGDAVFSSHQVARGKPAPDLFLFTAAAMDVAPGRCMVIEDSIYGIQGARAAGMTAIGFAGGSHIGPGHRADLERHGAALVVGGWAEMLRHFEA